MLSPRTVACPPPSRPRAADQLLELFLHAWHGGRFTHRLHWLPQNRRHVAVIGRDAGGASLAVAHTRILAEKQEPFFRGLTAALVAEPRLDVPGRRFDLSFYPKFLRKALAREREQATLMAWAVATLPPLPIGHRQQWEIPVPLPSGKVGSVRVDVAVLERTCESSAVWVSGYSPATPQRLRPAVRQALGAQLPKLEAAPASRRVLLLEVPAMPWQVSDVVGELADGFPLLACVDDLVVADTRAEVVFWIGDGRTATFRESLAPFVREPPALVGSGPLASLAGQAREFAAAAKAQNTLRAYAADWNDFRDWCAEHDVSPLPAAPETVALYLTDRAATLKTASLARRLTTINRAHEVARHPSPATMHNAVVSEVWKGIRRTKGTAQEGKKPFLTLDLRKISAALPDNLQGARDRALLLTGFAGGFRRSELARLRIEDFQDTPEGIVIFLRRSKTDQEGQGRPVALPYGSDPLTCPVRAVRAWITAAGLTSGEVFRGVDQFGLVSEKALRADSVAWIVKRAARRAGFTPLEYSGHSLRAGLATQAAMNGAGELAIMKQTGHRSLATVRRYIRDGALFRDNAATKLGL